MESRKLSFEESLGKNVVQANRCVGCATCLVVYTFKYLEFDSGQPMLACIHDSFLQLHGVLLLHFFLHLEEICVVVAKKLGFGSY